MKEVYADSPIEYNRKIRHVVCPHCLNELDTDLPGPKCGYCRCFMITILENINEKGDSKTHF